MAEVDQAVVDEILAKAAEDTEEGRLERLEREVETLKGSIKRLLLDIRETMNKLENPFVNLQSLAEANIVPQSAPQIQIIPTKIPEEETKKEIKEEEKKLGEVEEGKQKDIEGVETKDVIPERLSAQRGIKESAPAKETIRVEGQTKKVVDFMTLYRLAEWVSWMTSKHSYEAFKLTLEIFETTGYLSSETKELLMMLAEISKLNGTKELLIELYKLNKALKPDDRSLDSDLLALLLEKR